MTLEEQKAELRRLADTGERLPGCYCSRETIPFVRVVIAADCNRHGRDTEVYQSTRDDLIRRAGDPTPPVKGIGIAWMRYTEEPTKQTSPLELGEPLKIIRSPAPAAPRAATSRLDEIRALARRKDG